MGRQHQADPKFNADSSPHHLPPRSIAVLSDLVLQQHREVVAPRAAPLLVGRQRRSAACGRAPLPPPLPPSAAAPSTARSPPAAAGGGRLGPAQPCRPASSAGSAAVGALRRQPVRFGSRPRAGSARPGVCAWPRRRRPRCRAACRPNLLLGFFDCSGCCAAAAAENCGSSIRNTEAAEPASSTIASVERWVGSGSAPWPQRGTCSCC